jgi:hypothetical protein
MANNTVRVLSALAPCLLSVATARAAEIRNFTQGDGKPAIGILRRIDADDASTFADAVETLHRQTGRPYSDIIVWMDSPGGDLRSLDIGRYIHQLHMRTFVPGTQCDSLCAYIWLAGRA